MLGMKNHFDISDSIEIREVDIAGVACICPFVFSVIQWSFSLKHNPRLTLKKIYLPSPDQHRKNAPTPKNLLAIKKKIFFFISSVKIQFLYFI